MKEQGSKYILLAVPAVNAGLFPLSLPIPTISMAGGYRGIGKNGQIIPMYSPIDIAICGLTALYNREQSVTSLNDWFLNNPDPIAEVWVTCTLLNFENQYINTYSIAEYKIFCEYDSALLTLFKKNAPFTFRRS